jgi:hypothetical protein
VSKNVHVFVRLPPRIVARIRVVLADENERRARRGLDPILLFGQPPGLSLPQWLIRAGKRETKRAWRKKIPPARVIGIEECLTGPTVSANFCVSSRMATRSLEAITLVNMRRAARGALPVCLRGGAPSLPQWFVRAGLRELRRQERRIARAKVETRGAA